MHAGPSTATDAAISERAPMTAYINRIGTAVPANDVHEPFVEFGAALLDDERTSLLFRRASPPAPASPTATPSSRLTPRTRTTRPNSTAAPSISGAASPPPPIACGSTRGPPRR